MPGHRTDELVPPEGVDRELVDGTHGRRARKITEERDLAEEVAGPDRLRRPVDEHLRAT